MLIVVAVYVGIANWQEFYPPIGAYIAVLAFLAVVVTIWPPENAWGKAAWLVIFFIAMGMEVQNLFHERSENQSAQSAAKKAEDDRFADLLKDQHESFAKVLDRDQERFEKTVGRLSSISKTATEALGNVTGGDSYSVMGPVGPILRSLRPSFGHYGKYPLYQLNVQISDVTDQDDPKRSFTSMMEHTIYLHTDELDPRKAWVPGVEIPFISETKNMYNVFFSARNNNYWLEQMIIQRVNGEWAIAERVSRNGKYEEMVPPGFPRNSQGLVDWPK